MKKGTEHEPIMALTFVLLLMLGFFGLVFYFLLGFVFIQCWDILLFPFLDYKIPFNCAQIGAVLFIARNFLHPTRPIDAAYVEERGMRMLWYDLLKKWSFSLMIWGLAWVYQLLFY